jgi:hypothetical protein
LSSLLLARRDRPRTVAARMTRVEGKGPPLRWFVERAFDGWAPKLALVDAAIATFVGVVAAIAWRVTSGPRGGFEQIVPMLGLATRWSVALPIAWRALGWAEDDRRAGVLELMTRHGASIRRFLVGRAIGAGTLVAMTVGGPMLVVSLLCAGLGGGRDGALARASLAVPSIASALAAGLVFGVGAVVVGVLVPSRWLALALAATSLAVGAFARVAIPGGAGVVAEIALSPLHALERLHAALFDAPNALGPGLFGAVAVAVVAGLGLVAATRSVERGALTP